MSSGIPLDQALLIGSILVIGAVVAARLAARLRLPTMLAFIGVGMLVADDGLAWIRFDDALLARDLGVAALALIIFEGALTVPRRLRPGVLAAGSLLATLGVALTAGGVAVVAATMFGLDTTSATLLGAVVASTDAAAVFAALRQVALPARVRQTLEVESGANDPVAVLLTVGVIETWQNDPGAADWLVFAAKQVSVGVGGGVAVGIAATVALRRASLPGGLRGVAGVGLAGLSYSVAATLGGSGLLACFVAGFVLRRSAPAARVLTPSLRGLSELADIALFLMLGLLVFPSRLADVAIEGIVIALALIFLARPVAVFVTLAALRLPRRETALVAWGGLRGAAPVVLATFALTASYPDAERLFDIVFFVVIVSAAVQGTTMERVSRALGVEHHGAPVSIVTLARLDEGVEVVELELDADHAVVHRSLAAVPTPDGARIVAIHREDEVLVPDGRTLLQLGDRVVLGLRDGLVSHEDLRQWAAGAPPTGGPSVR